MFSFFSNHLRRGLASLEGREQNVSTSPPPSLLFFFSVRWPTLSYQPGLFIKLVFRLSCTLWHHTFAVVVELCSLLSFSVCRPLLAFLRATIFCPCILLFWCALHFLGLSDDGGEESACPIGLEFSLSVSCAALLVVVRVHCPSIA